MEKPLKVKSIFDEDSDSDDAEPVPGSLNAPASHSESTNTIPLKSSVAKTISSISRRSSRSNSSSRSSSPILHSKPPQNRQCKSQSVSQDFSVAILEETAVENTVSSSVQQHVKLPTHEKKHKKKSSKRKARISPTFGTLIPKIEQPDHPLKDHSDDSFSKMSIVKDQDSSDTNKNKRIDDANLLQGTNVVKSSSSIGDESFKELQQQFSDDSEEEFPGFERAEKSTNSSGEFAGFDSTSAAAVASPKSKPEAETAQQQANDLMRELLSRQSMVEDGVETVTSPGETPAVKAEKVDQTDSDGTDDPLSEVNSQRNSFPTSPSREDADNSDTSASSRVIRVEDVYTDSENEHSENMLQAVLKKNLSKRLKCK